MVVTVKLPAVPVVKVVELPLVIAGAVPMLTALADDVPTFPAPSDWLASTV